VGFAAVVVVMVSGWAVNLGWWLPELVEPYRDYRPFAAEVRRLAPAPVRVIFFRTEAHTLAFRVGRPLDVLVEWQHLQARLEQPGMHYLVMPPKSFDRCREVLRNIDVEEVCWNTTLAGGAHERPLVLLRAKRRSK
jgi:hypothetical protein